MKCFLKYIGAFDFSQRLHHVELFPGLNVITGKSSTGKSAILEIFDYCMGSLEDTIPVGIITERVEIFFIVLQFDRYLLVAAREQDSEHCYLREFGGVDSGGLLDLMSQPKAFFDAKYFMPLDDFKKALGRHFAITLENVDEDPFLKVAGRKKSATPSVRSFSSFMLQHQNLIANKHAIFYRFDQKEKRDQAINHFKILMGLVDESYFDIHKEYELARYELKRVQAQIPRLAQRKQSIINSYDRLLAEYENLAGVSLVDATGAQIFDKPKSFLKYISEYSVRVDVLSDKLSTRLDELNQARIKILLEKRTLQGQLRLVNNSLASSTQFDMSMAENTLPHSIDISEAHCPMCNAETSIPAMEVNKLVGAIDWLNDELKLSSYARESFAGEKRKILDEIEKRRVSLQAIEDDERPLKEESNRLASSKSVDEQALKSKLRLEIAIQEQLDNPQSELADEEQRLLAEVQRLDGLISKYKVEEKLSALGNLINSRMCEFANKFDFEETYKPSALRFDLETFDLWHQKDADTRVYLRSMGSGANWLYSHLSLFMALHYSFAKRSNEGCKIPPILFLDQPTQVYFPASLDDAEIFNAVELAKQSKREKKLDDDLSAVSNIFTQLARYCLYTMRNTGVCPQIIVSDHADKLTLGDGLQFKDYVRARWRTRGFID